jgi:ATP-dependent DNA ligase
MASAQAAQPVKKNATKIPPRKASAHSNSTFVLAVDTPPMEARAAEVIPCDGERWQYEPKWDGFRCLAFKSGDAIDLRAKSGKPLGRYFPEIVSLLRDISAPQFVVDGELVIESEGRLVFDMLQMRLHPAESQIRKLSVEIPARLILFDMLVDTDGRKLIVNRWSSGAKPSRHFWLKPQYRRSSSFRRSHAIATRPRSG